MVTFLQRTFTSLVHAHAGRRQVPAQTPFGLDVANAPPVWQALCL